MNPRSPIQHPNQFYIDGQWVSPATDAQFTVINSSTEEVFEKVAEASGADVNRAVEAARRAFDQGPWPRMTPQERAPFLRALADELDRSSVAAAMVWSCESGIVNSAAVPVTQTLGDVFRFYADLANTFTFQEIHPSAGPGYVGMLVHEPVGVAGIIVPWNGPTNISAIKIAPALLAGCTLVLKFSPEAPGFVYLFAEACEKVGLPPGVINMITANREVSELLVRHPGVDKISFTGSTAAGRRIGAICGERMARMTLELGGKSAAIICDDFDVEAAGKLLAQRATFLTGQTCSLLTRVIVPRSRHDALVEAMCDYFAGIKVGDPFDAATGMGPLATSMQLERVQGYISKGQAEGAKLATGGKRPSDLKRGFFIEPTVFANVDNRMVVSREEIFGPVLSVIPVDDDAQAVAVANDNEYGLGGAVFTNDVERAYKIARQVRTGTMAHNTHRTEMLIAYGGVKNSGVGRMGGVEGLRAYLEPKTLSMASLPVSAGLAS